MPRKKFGWGGSRPGSGRKRTAFGQNVEHRARPPHRAEIPLHVTVSSLRGNLRTREVLALLRFQVKRVRDEAGDFRIVHYSLRADHIHLIVEAKDERALSSGMLGMLSALARAINKLHGTSGKVWKQRYHVRKLKTPFAVRQALVQVLRNAATGGEDSFSSSSTFDGFAGKMPKKDYSVASARTPLLRVSWRKHGLIRANERPKSPPKRGVVIWDYLGAS
jgi:REP element-mobilizing transposase RayT